jgi:hypothetical protein
MNIASRLRSHHCVRAAIVAASLAAMLTACSATGSGRSSSTTPAPPASSTVASASGHSADAARVVLRVGNDLATATLDSAPAAREFAAMLPLSLTLHDPMGQAKSGRLPYRIAASGASRVIDPTVAGIYYWSPTGDIAIFYDDLGQSVPPPGLVRLGSVDRGLGKIASAGNQFTVWINVADPTES